MWTPRPVMWMASRFPPVVHQLSPGYPLMVHKVIHKAYPQIWITRVGNLWVVHGNVLRARYRGRAPGHRGLRRRHQLARACCLMRLVSSVTWV